MPFTAMLHLSAVHNHLDHLCIRLEPHLKNELGMHKAVDFHQVHMWWKLPTCWRLIWEHPKDQVPL